MALTRPRAAQIYDIDYKQATRVVTVANITLSGGAPSQVDGVNLSLNDRVLVTGQSTLSQNGIYYVTTLGSGSNGTWSRSLDTNSTGEILTGTIVMVTEGTIYADTQWKLITDGVINVGVTDQVWTQNYSANSISSGNSNVVVNSNANVTVSSAGTANVLTISSTGIVVSGTGSVTGNITGANILTGGIVSATGNITGANILTSGLISAAGNITGNALQLNTSVTPIVAATGQAFWDTDEHTVTLGMENGVQQQIGLENYMYVKASAAITNGQAVMFTGANGTNILAAPADTTSVGFKPEYIIGVATQDIALNAFGYITVYGLVHGLNTNAYTVGDILWVDNATPGALTNVQPSDPNFQIQMAAVTKKAGDDGHIMVRPTPFYDINRITNVLTTSPTTGQSLVYDGANSIWINGIAASANTAGTVTTNAQPNITSVGTLSSLSVTGNVTGDYFLGNVFYANGITASKIYSGTSEVNVTSSGGNVNVSIGGTSNVAVFTTTGEYVTGVVSATGNVTGGNVLTSGVVSATGNVTGDYILGNVFYASGITASKIYSGNSEVNVTSSGGNVNVSIGGTANVVVWSTAGEYVAGLQSVTGNITAGNVLTAGLISATGNVTGGNVSTAGNVAGAYLLGNASQVTGINTFNQIFVTGTNTINASGLTSNVTFTAGNNISLTSSANVITIAYSASGSGSIFATGGDMGLISQSVTASEDLGSVDDTPTISYDLGTLFSVTTANQLDVTGFTGNVNAANVNLTGLISAAGNITGNYFLGNGSQLTGVSASATFPLANGTSNINATSGGNITISVGGTSNVVVYTTSGESVAGNITGGNVLTGGLISATGNVTGGNIRTAGLISATGNVTGGNIIGNGSTLTGIGLIKAWVNFNANATVNGSFNVANVVNVSTGVYTINFTTALSNANYCPMIVASFQSGVTEVVIATVYNDSPYAPTASNVTVSFHNTAGTRVNPTFGYVTIVGT